MGNIYCKCYLNIYELVSIDSLYEGGFSENAIQLN